MAIVIKENERLYLRNWEYNASRVITRLAQIVIANGGKVKPIHNAIISNSTLQNHINQLESTLTQLKALEHIPAREEAIAAKEKELATYKAINNDPITVTHTSYISFVLNGIYYYFQVDHNFLFPFHYQKTPVVNNKRSRDAYLEESKKEWVYDSLLSCDCNEEIIEESANALFNELITAKNSGIHKEKSRRRVPNTYNNGYHYETVYEKERFETIDF